MVQPKPPVESCELSGFSTNEPFNFNPLEPYFVLARPVTSGISTLYMFASVFVLNDRQLVVKVETDHFFFFFVL